MNSIEGEPKGRKFDRVLLVPDEEERIIKTAKNSKNLDGVRHSLIESALQRAKRRVLQGSLGLLS